MRSNLGGSPIKRAAPFTHKQNRPMAENATVYYEMLVPGGTTGKSGRNYKWQGEEDEDGHGEILEAPSGELDHVAKEYETREQTKRGKVKTKKHPRYKVHKSKPSWYKKDA